ncbi:Zinc finger CCHC-type and RNA-binding motif-containing protein 1 [Manis javanica]|nr:Zinc finger CCHC-type and RNA-binding motif-containing protein 1 [Manis javanica]
MSGPVQESCSIVTRFHNSYRRCSSYHHFIRLCAKLYQSNKQQTAVRQSDRASVAINTAEVIRRHSYFDKSQCYECVKSGHLSYACPKNMLGECEPPKKKEKKKKKKIPKPEEEVEEVEESEEEGEDPALGSLGQAIAFQQARIEEEQKKWKRSPGGPSTSDDSRHPRIKKSTYFSDEEEVSD